MKDLAVITGCSKPSGMFWEYKNRLEKAGIDLLVETVPGADNLDTIGTVFPRVKRQIEEASEYKQLVLSDGWDVVFFGTKDEVTSKIPANRVLIAGERNCFPDLTLQDKIEGPSPWKFANGGLACGTPDSLYAWLDYMEDSPHYHPKLTNQGLYNILLLHGKLGAELDYFTEVFYCIYGETNELQFNKGIPINTKYGNHPHFVHANGKWPMAEIWQRYEWSIGHVAPVDLKKVIIPFSSQIEVDVCPKCRDRIVAGFMKND